MDDAPGVSVAPQYYDLQTKAGLEGHAATTPLRLDFFGSSDRMVLHQRRRPAASPTWTWSSTATSSTRPTCAWTTGLATTRGSSCRWAAAGRRWWPSSATTSPRPTRSGAAPTAPSCATASAPSPRPHARRRRGVGPERQGRASPPARSTRPARSPPAPEDLQTPNRFQQDAARLRGGRLRRGALRAGAAGCASSRASAPTCTASLAARSPGWTRGWRCGPSSDASTALKAGVGLYHQAPPVAYLTDGVGQPRRSRPEARLAVLGRAGAEVPAAALARPRGLLQAALRPGHPLLRRRGPQRPGGAGALPQRRNRAEPTAPRCCCAGTRTAASSAGSPTRSPASGATSRSAATGSSRRGTPTTSRTTWWRWVRSSCRRSGTASRPASGSATRPATPTSASAGAVYDADGDGYQPVTTGRYDSRMPDFFQLDLRVDKKWTHRLWTCRRTSRSRTSPTARTPSSRPTTSTTRSRAGSPGIGFFPAFGVRAEY